MNYFGTLFCSNSLLNYYLSNIPAAPAYGVYISQLIRYSRLSGSYRYFFERGVGANKEVTESRVTIG